MINRMKFLNTEVDNLTMQEALGQIESLVTERKNAYVVTPNVDHIIKIEKDPFFREIYEHADLVLTDGKPLIWIAKWFRTPIKEKVSGSDLFPKVCELAAEKEYRLFFLGAAPGVANRAAQNIRKIYPDIRITGTYSPKLGFETDVKEMTYIRELIQQERPDILILALGTPKQEYYIYQNRDALGVPVSLCLGASLDFAAGNVKRAPRWMQNCGLEWLYRLCKEPKRLFRRYLIDDIQIFRLAWKYRKKDRTYENSN